MNWADTPPTETGWYWIRRKQTGLTGIFFVIKDELRQPYRVLVRDGGRVVPMEEFLKRANEHQWWPIPIESPPLFGERE